MSDETELNRKVKLSTDKESEMNKSPGTRLAKWIDLVESYLILLKTIFRQNQFQGVQHADHVRYLVH